MAWNIEYKPKLKPDGSRYIDPVTNDFVNEEVSRVEVPDIILPINWNGLTQALWSNPALMGKAITAANPNAYSTLLKVLTDGEISSASENAFKSVFNMLGVSWTPEEKATINQYLADNNFTITI